MNCYKVNNISDVGYYFKIYSLYMKHCYCILNDIIWYLFPAAILQ